MLKGNDYVRIWINRGGNNLPHSPAAVSVTGRGAGRAWRVGQVSRQKGNLFYRLTRPT